MDCEELERLLDGLPRKRLLFLPTPFHKLENLSKKYGMDMYIKRDDMTGPSNFGGNKTRKLEFILGEALEKDIEYLISVGGYQTNSGMEMTAFARLCGLKPILYLGDVIDQGEPEEYKGNLLLNKLMDCEIHYVLKEPGRGTSINRLWDTMMKLSEKRKEGLEKQGHKAMVIPSGCVSPVGWVSYVIAFKEIMEQSRKMGVSLDYLFHTAGTGGSLPGLIAGKMLLGSNIKIISIAINPYGPNEICNEDILCDRVKYVFEALKKKPPKKEDILSEIHIDQNYIGKDYGVPSKAGSAAIRELAQEEALFTDPVYSGKGFAGFLDYIRSGKVPKTSKIAFLHTGGTGALFAEEGLTGRLVF